jgi:D-sedoheptulose 7-phosphate isomerase
LGTPDFDSGCARRFGKNYRLLHDPSHISLFSNDSIQRFLRDHGFIIDRVEYPFFETRYFTQENLMRLFDTTQISPPFYGNFITFYCHKPDRGVIYEAIMDLSLLAAKVADEMEEKIKKAAQLISDCFRAGGKVLACGNGDSAVNVQHFVAELGCCTKRMKQLLLINLQDLDSSGLKIWGKDDGSDCVFNFKIKKLGQPGDVLLFVSSKCCSAKPSKALKTARSRGLKSIALLSEVDLPFLKEGDVYIKILSRNTHRIKEVHSVVLHAIYNYLEQQVA